MKSQIHLIRHGITEGNLKRLCYGASDIPLADEGVAQLRELAQQGIYPKFEAAAFYTTGLQRTEQTLELIYGVQDHEKLRELREMEFGEFEMKSPDDLKDIPEYIYWFEDTTGDAASPGGESVNGFYARICEGYKTLAGRHRLRELSVRHCGKDAVTVMVCHGGTIAAIMKNIFPGKHEDFFRWIPDPGHGYTLNFENSDVVGYDSF